MPTGKRIPMSGNNSSPPVSIDDLRDEIDRLDSELLSIFNRRAVVRLFERVIDESRRLERIMTHPEEPGDREH